MEKKVDLKATKNKILERAKEVLRIEADAIKAVIEDLDENFEKAVKLILACKGRVVVTGMGKPGIIGQKIAATLASTGTPAMSLHPAEAIHGDLGKITKEDIVIAISNSGETEEIIKLIPSIKKIGIKLISITGDEKSTLAKNSDIVLKVKIDREACPLGLAPTASTTASLAMGDALALALLDGRNFSPEDYAFYHPGGSLGKKLLKVRDIMRTESSNPVVKEDTLVKEVLVEITGARAGAASIINDNGEIAGIFTDGDLRRKIETKGDLLNKKVCEVMTKNPKTISSDKFATEALRMLREYKIDEIIVIDDNKYPIGMLDVQDLLKAGII